MNTETNYIGNISEDDLFFVNNRTISSLLKNLLVIALTIAIGMYCTQTIIASTPCVTQHTLDLLSDAAAGAAIVAATAAATAAVAQTAAVAAWAILAAGSWVPGVDLALLAAAVAAQAYADWALSQAATAASFAVLAEAAYLAAKKLPLCCP